MIRILRHIADDLKQGENLDVYLSIPLTIVIAILGILNVVSFEIVGAGILATLALLSASLLSNRKTSSEAKISIEKLNSAVRDLERTIQKDSTISDVFTKSYPDMSQEIRSAKNVSVLSLALSSTISRYFTEFSQVVKNGGSLKFIVCDTSPKILELLTLRSQSIRTADDYLYTHQSNLARVKSLRQLISTSECVQARALPYLPSVGMVAIEYPNKRSRIYVQLIAFKNKFETTPGFIVDQVDDPYWYDFFFSQFNEYWTISQSIEFH